MKHTPLSAALFAILLSGAAWSYHVTEVTQAHDPLACTADSVFDCGRTLQSAQSSVLRIPISTVAMIFFSFLFVHSLLTFMKSRVKSGQPVQLFAALLACGYLAGFVALYYAGVSAFVLHSLCLYCAVLYGVILATILVSHLGLKVPLRQQPTFLLNSIRQTTGIGVFRTAVALSIAIGVSIFITIQPVGSETVLNIETSHERIDVTEFIDFECPACKRVAVDIAELKSSHPDTVSVHYVNYPLCTECNPDVIGSAHPHACVAAKIGLALKSRGKFEQYCERVLVEPRDASPEVLAEIVTALGEDPREIWKLANEPRTFALLREDIDHARAIGVRQTPSVQINGQMLNGRTAVAQLKSALGAGVKLASTPPQPLAPALITRFDAKVATRATSGPVNVTLDGSQKFQTMDGVGVNINANSWNGDQLKPALDLLLNTNGASVFRVIRDPMTWVSSESLITPLHNLDAATLQQVYEAPAMQQLWNTIAYLNQNGIRGRQVMINFMGWTPTWLGGSGQYGVASHITAGKESEAATMLASLVYYGRKVRNLDFKMFGPFNESDLSGGTEGPAIGASQYATLLHALVTELNFMGMTDIEIDAPDLASSGLTENYVSAFWNDTLVKPRVTRLGVHGYGGAMSPGPRAIPYWVTETAASCGNCDNSGTPSQGEWSFASDTNDFVIQDLANGFPGLYIYDGYDSFYFHHNAYGMWGLLSYDPSTGIYTPRKRFYANAQIAKFVRPGATQIGESDTVSGLTSVAFFNSAAGQFTYVGHNSGAAVTLNVQLQNLPAIGSLALYETNSGAMNLARQSDVPVSGGTFNVVVPGDTFFTLTTISSALSIGSGPTLPAGTVGAAYSQNLIATGGTPPYAWSLSAGTLPAGLTLSSTGLISGTPSAMASANFTVKVTDATNTTVTKALTITINGANLAPSGTAYRWFGMTSSTANTNRTAEPKLNDSDTTTDFALTGSSDDTGNAYEAAGIQWSNAQTMTQVVFINGTYVPSQDGVFDANFKLQFSQDGTTWVDSSGWTVSPAYSYNSAAAGGVGYTWTGPATSAIGVRCVGQVRTSETGVNSWYANAREMTVQGSTTAASLAITTASPLPVAKAGAAYSLTFTATGGTPPYTWSLAAGALPQGLSLSSAGILSGTPATRGTSLFVIQVADSASKTATQTYSLTVNQAPTVATAASATPNPVVGKTCDLSVLGADDGGEASLTYTWVATSSPATVSFSVNGSNSANKSTVTFTTAGTYTFQATITDTFGLSVASSISVMVNQTLSGLGVSPSAATVVPNSTQQFSASGADQFGKAMTAPAVNWSVSGGGAISSTGLFTAGASAGGPFTLTATAGALSTTASVTISSSINIAPNGSAYRWFGTTSSTTNTNKTAAPKLNDGNLTANVDLSGAQNDNVNAWEAAGVTWSTAQSVSKVVFRNGSYDPSEDGVFDANFKLQSSADGTTWSDVAGWTLTPAYAYNSASAGGVAYTFTGAAITARGIRCIGQVHTATTGVNSWYVNATEVQVFGGSSAPTAPAITTQPANQTVVAGQAATFSVAASGSAPLTYQWQKNGIAISAATGANYTTPAATLSDNGALFKVIVSNSAGSVTSASATLTVNSGNQPPVISSAATAAPNPALVGQAVSFMVAASDPNGDTLTYAWDFGDGTSGSGASAAHTYAAAGNFTAVAAITDGKGGSVSSSVVVTINAQPQSQTLLTTQQPVASYTDGSNVDYELGMRLQSDTAGQITAIRFYKSINETGTHTGHIWSANGTLLATVVFINETISGWQEQALSTPLNITASTEYLVSVNTGNTFYVADDSGFANQIVNGDLSSIVGGNGRYGSVGSYPTSTWMSANYFRDVRFVPQH